MNKIFEEYANQLKNQKLFEMEKIYQEHFPEFVPFFQKHFQGTCENIIKMQKAGILGKISYLEYTLLYTNMLQKKKLPKYVFITTTGTLGINNRLLVNLIFLVYLQNTMSLRQNLWHTIKDLQVKPVDRKSSLSYFHV